MSADNVLGSGDPFLGSRSLAGLAPLTSSAATTVVHVPASVAPGSYYLVAVVDPDNKTAESNESNKTFVSSVPIPIR